jgi:hypothetical protein
MDSKYLDEAREIEHRWNKTGLLARFDDPFARATIAVLLENQKLMSEQSLKDPEPVQFKRISIPLIRRIYPQLICSPINPNWSLRGNMVEPEPEQKTPLYRSLDDDWDS